MVEPRRLGTVIAAVLALVFGLGAYTTSVAQAHSLEASTLTKPIDPGCVAMTSSVPCAQPCAALCHIVAPAMPGLARPFAVVSLVYRMSPEGQAGRPAPPDPPPPR